MLVRLQKYIAEQGICSRRKAEELILAGKIRVNGTIAKIGMKIDPETDKIEIQEFKDLKNERFLPKDGYSFEQKDFSEDKQQNIILPGSSVSREKILFYIALNKPVDYITSTSDEQGPSVLNLLKAENFYKSGGKDFEDRVYPVGRLDKDSEGLVLLTNDGDLANLLTHPRYEHEKEYEVTISPFLTREAKNILQKGMMIDEEEMLGVKIVEEFKRGRQEIINLILREGKNRQIRKMFGRLGFNVIKLSRVRIGKLKLGTLAPGKWRFVRKDQIM